MRWSCLALAAAVACGGTSSPSGSGTGTGTGSTGSPDGGATAFALTLDVSGSGAVNAPGQTCAGHCVLQVAAGQLHLEAVPASGWHFDHWSRTCSAASCDLTVGADLSLSIVFAQDPPPPVPQRNLSVAVSGPGRVVSSPAGIDCPGDCDAVFADGMHVLFTATPNAGAKFDGFSGACGGTACTVTLGTDAAVGAKFEALAPVQHLLTVNSTGTGTVTSTPAGIDCPGTCVALFDEGTKVTLTTFNGSGFDFGGFSGACTGTGCTVTMSGSETVGVAFVAKPDPCAGLMPASISPPIAVSVERGINATSIACTTGTSDGLGDLAVLSVESFPDGVATQRVGYYKPSDFGAVQFNVVQTGGQQQIVLLPQPQGFGIVFGNEPFDSWVFLDTFNATGAFTSGVVINNGQADTSGQVTADPAGGYAVVRSYPLSGANFVVTWQRYDAGGVAASLELQIATGQRVIENVSFSPSGDALVVMRAPDLSGRVATWVTRTGTVLTSLFALSPSKVVLSALADGSQLVRALDGSPMGVVPDSSPRLLPAPAWLAARPSAAGPFSFRAGKAYAMFATPHCPQMEVLTASGISCGCANVAEVGKTATAGLDGTIIAPSGATSGQTCHFQIFPHALP